MRALPPLLLLAGAAAAQPAWETGLPGIAPALRACLADRPGAMVVDAWSEPGGTTARLLLPGGAREDCGPGGQRSPAESRREGEGIRAFMLERRCVDARRVEDAAGRELGWLAYPACG